MQAFLENAGFLLLVVIATTAVIKFRARRYLIILIIGTAVGAWLIGYSFGARSVASAFYPFVQVDRFEQAKAGMDLPSPLWGVAFGVLIIFVDHLVFGTDVRKNFGRKGFRLPPGSDRDASDDGVKVGPGQSQAQSPLRQKAAEQLQTPNGV